MSAGKTRLEAAPFKAVLEHFWPFSQPFWIFSLGQGPYSDGLPPLIAPDPSPVPNDFHLSSVSSIFFGGIIPAKAAIKPESISTIGILPLAKSVT